VIESTATRFPDGDPLSRQRAAGVMDRLHEFRHAVVELGPKGCPEYGVQRLEVVGGGGVDGGVRVETRRSVHRHYRDRSEVVHVAGVDRVGHVTRGVRDVRCMKQDRQFDILTLHLGLEPVESGPAHAGEVGNR